MFKPSFGQTTSNTSFGGFGSSGTSTPFGQSTFNKPQGSTFGSAPAFGSSATPVFGSQAQTSSGLFGSSAPTPAFGQAQPVQSGFGFGASTSGTTNLFGSSQPSGSGLFGSNSAPTFGQQNKPAFSGFSTNPGSALFGSQQTTQVQPSATPLFGQPSTQTSGLFSSNAFGTTGNATTGTVIRFNPVTGTDTINKNQITQTISTRHECITCMKEYEGKSLEELRLEDYLANRKGPQQGAAGTSGLFGSNTLFGSQNPSNTSVGFGAAPSVFGSSNTQTNTLFGNKGFGTVTTSASPFAFNATSTVTPFGAKPFGATTSSASNLFSTPAAQNSGFGTTSSGFGSFGVQNTGSTTSFFNQQKPIGTGFNMPSATGTGFGSMSQSSSSTSVFGAPKPLAPTFGSSTTGFGTAQNTGFSTATPFQTTQQTNNMFSSFNKPSTTGFGLGTTPAASNDNKVKSSNRFKWTINDSNGVRTSHEIRRNIQMTSETLLRLYSNPYHLEAGPEVNYIDDTDDENSEHELRPILRASRSRRRAMTRRAMRDDRDFYGSEQSLVSNTSIPTVRPTSPPEHATRDNLPWFPAPVEEFSVASSYSLQTYRYDELDDIEQDIDRARSPSVVSGESIERYPLPILPFRLNMKRSYQNDEYNLALKQSRNDSYIPSIDSYECQDQKSEFGLASIVFNNSLAAAAGASRISYSDLELSCIKPVPSYNPPRPESPIPSTSTALSFHALVGRSEEPILYPSESNFLPTISMQSLTDCLDLYKTEQPTSCYEMFRNPHAFNPIYDSQSDEQLLNSVIKTEATVSSSSSYLDNSDSLTIELMDIDNDAEVNTTSVTVIHSYNPVNPNPDEKPDENNNNDATPTNE